MAKINKNEQNEAIAMFRYNIIAPLITQPDQFESDHAFFEMRSKEKFTYIDGRVLSVSASTIERWYYKYRKDGLNAIKPQRRSDFGKRRKVDGDIYDKVANLKTNFPRMSATKIFNDLYSSGNHGFSLSTINRLVNEIKKSTSTTTNNEMLRYERAHINEVWCGDSTTVRADSLKEKPSKLYIIALIDDASRLITCAKVFENDNSINLMEVLKSGISKYGIPSVLNFDNGKNYRNKQLELISAKLASSIHYCRPYTPTAKAKIERWFRTLKDGWSCNGLKTIEEIQSSLDSFVFAYNNKIHSSLKGKTPAERFNMELNIVRYLNNEQKKNAFLFEVERKVSIDCVAKVESEEYQVPYQYSNQRIKIFYEPNLSHVYIQNNDSKPLEIFKLNKVANSKAKREKLTDILGE